MFRGQETLIFENKNQILVDNLGEKTKGIFKNIYIWPI